MAARFQAEASLREMYELRDGVAPEDQHIFYANLEEHLTSQTTEQIQAHVHRWGKVVKVSVKQYAARIAAGIQPIWKALSMPKPKPKRPQPKPRRPKKKEQSTHLTHFYEVQPHRSTSQPPSETPPTTLIRNPYAQHPSQQWVPAPAQAPRASITSRIRQGIRSGISFVQQQLNFPDHPG